jgi:hypothetical protein
MIPGLIKTIDNNDEKKQLLGYGITKPTVVRPSLLEGRSHKSGLAYIYSASASFLGSIITITISIITQSTLSLNRVSRDRTWGMETRECDSKKCRQCLISGLRATTDVCRDNRTLLANSDCCAQICTPDAGRNGLSFGSLSIPVFESFAVPLLLPYAKAPAIGKHFTS